MSAIPAKPRILSDVTMPQCPLWGKETALAPRLFSRARVLPGLRKLEPLYEFFDLCWASRGHDVVVTANLRSAQLYGLVRGCFPKLLPRQVVLELMLAAPRPRLLGRIREKWLRACFRNTDAIFVSSRQEVALYGTRLGIPAVRLHFLPFHSNFSRPQCSPHDEGYVFSAGRSGRDFATLAKALEKTNAELVLVAEASTARSLQLPASARVHCDIPYERYVELVQRCHFVVVPLFDAARSTGQVVLLEAMSLGKPVIATATLGTVDYIVDGENGLLVPPGDASALAAAIERLRGDRELFERLVRNGMQTVRREHSFESYVLRILRAAWEVMPTPKESRREEPPPFSAERARKP